MGVLLVKLLLTQILAGRTNWGSLGTGQNSLYILSSSLSFWVKQAQKTESQEL